METRIVNNKEYKIIKLLGKGKGGYSYLAEYKDKQCIVKQIHHEPCSYYTFGNKIQSEINDYNKLSKLNINISKMIDYDEKTECIIKEYIEGPTIYDIVLEFGQIEEKYFEQVFSMCKVLYKANTNIDYFPTNFIINNGRIYYIDFECNDYEEKWNFENWGIAYWLYSKELIEHAKEHGFEGKIKEVLSENEFEKVKMELCKKYSSLKSFL